MKAWISRRDWRLGCRVGACAALALALNPPTVPWPKSVYRYLFVLDITQSMNARDYHVEGLPGDRLGYVKASLALALRELPCGSEVGLGVYATQHSQVLFEPVEVCSRIGLISTVLEGIDWRMAWAGDSHIAQGLYTGLRRLADTDPTIRLVFFSDGQQFPPQTEIPPFPGKPHQVAGLIVGAGGPQPVPIPRYDRDNRPLGYWQYVDVQDSLPRSQLEGRPANDRSNYPSRLDEMGLKALAAATGLNYHRLTTPQGLVSALDHPELAERLWVRLDLGPILASLALVLLVAPLLPDLIPRRRP
ncbi:vWA domain-containing protein [Methylococcus sp. EFPC2]|uniref:VWA domain-containing protein n=1 Tax=Methylococcus sp. EFPC2 TaxID=2812648 RepID=UPI001967756E|nr:vWA domain-containing protein [Methylococcus sp. EFPC2]QSA98433.1 VWA domain-containing protein [Methylococcus sp. EFPC2]